MIPDRILRFEIGNGVIYTELFRERGDFIDLMGRAAGTHVPAPNTI